MFKRGGAAPPRTPGETSREEIPGVEGWLEKKGKGKTSGWKWRWFRLEQTRLAYYKDYESADAGLETGSIDLTASPSPTVHVHPKTHEIELRATERVFQLRCQAGKEQAEQAEKWSIGLNKAIEIMGKQEMVRRRSLEKNARGTSSRRSGKGERGRDNLPRYVHEPMSAVHEISLFAPPDQPPHGETPLGEPPLEWRLGRQSLGGRAGCVGGDEALAGGRERRVKMEGLLMTFKNCDGTPAFDQVYALPHELHGCRLERRLGGRAETELVGFIDSAGLVREDLACVDVELRLNEDEDAEPTRLVAPNATWAAQWLLSLVAGAADQNKMTQGEHTAQEDAVPHQRVLTNSFFKSGDSEPLVSSMLRCDAGHNDPGQETACLAISLRDKDPQGVIFKAFENAKTTLYASLHYVDSDATVKKVKLFATEQLRPYKTESEYGVDFSVLLACNFPAADDSTGRLRVDVVATSDSLRMPREQPLGRIELSFAELRAASDNDECIQKETYSIPPPGDDDSVERQPEMATPEPEPEPDQTAIVSEGLPPERDPAAAERAVRDLVAGRGQDHGGSWADQHALLSNVYAQFEPLSADLSDQLMIARGGEPESSGSSAEEWRGLCLELYHKYKDKGWLHHPKEIETMEGCICGGHDGVPWKEVEKAVKKHEVFCKQSLQEKMVCRVTPLVAAPIELDPDPSSILAVQRYVLKLFVNAEGHESLDNPPAGQNALVTEVLSVPACGLDVPIAFLRGMIDHRRKQLASAVQSTLGNPDGLTERMKAQKTIAFWSELLPWYEQCHQFYCKQRDDARDARQSVLKPSKWKKEKLWGFVPTNLCVQRMMLTAAADDMAAGGAISASVPAHVAITSGCPAAHCHKLKKHGTRKLLNTLQRESEQLDSWIRSLQDAGAGTQLRQQRIQGIEVSLAAVWNNRDRKSKRDSGMWRLIDSGTVYSVHLHDDHGTTAVDVYANRRRVAVGEKVDGDDNDWAISHDAFENSLRLKRESGQPWKLIHGKDRVPDWLDEDCYTGKEDDRQMIERITMAKHRQIAKDGDEYTEYNIVVTCRDGYRTPPEGIWKRFGEFDALKAAIENSAGKRKYNVPQLRKGFPGKKLNADQRDKRMAELQAWVIQLSRMRNIQYNFHFLEFFELLLVNDADALTAMERQRSGGDAAEGDHGSELVVTASKIRRSPDLGEAYVKVLDLELKIASRRDVTVCQAISVLTAAFFATLEAIVADREYSAQHSGDDRLACRSLREASAELLKEVGFCLCVQSLLTCGVGDAHENNMLEDLSDAVQQLNRVTFVCSECAEENGPNECVAIKPIESSDLAANTKCRSSLEYEVQVQLSRACFEVPMFHKPAEQRDDMDLDDGEPKPAAPPISTSVDHMWLEPEPELEHDQSTGPRHVPVRAVLFSQGVNERQATTHKSGKSSGTYADSLQDQINEESLSGEGGMRELFRRLESRPFWADDDGGRSTHRQALAGLERAVQNKEKNTTVLEILTQASAFARSLGCALATHCKSGKDRTSMLVTLEQVAVTTDELQQFIPPCTLGPNWSSKSSKPGKQREVSDDKTPGKGVRQLMRSHGVRRENVRCNQLDTNADRYAFNIGQRRFLPKELRPPDGSFGSAPS